MAEIDYREIILESSFGYAYCRLILDGDGIPVDYEFIEVNRAFENQTGISSGTITGKRISSLSRGINFDTGYWTRFYGEVVLRNESRQYETYSEYLDRWYRAQASPRGDLCFVTLFFDITDLKKTESELADSARFNRTLIETIPTPVYYKNRNGRYIGVNRAFADFYGRTEDEMKDMTVHDIAPREYADIYYEMDNRLFENPGIQVYETQIRDSRDKMHEVVFHKATFDDGQGNTGGIIGVILDITERKQAEQELGLYYRAMQSIDQPVLITDSSGNITRVNNAFLKMYGYTPDELVGNNPRILNPGKDVYMDFGYTEEQHNELFSSMWKAISDPDTGTWENVVINRKKDGTLIWVKLLINAVYDDRHQPVNFIALPVDITSTLQTEAMTKIELYRTIAAIAELRDNETGNHMRRVGIFAKLMARTCGMPEKYCNDIEIFAPLHDIGKVGIQDSILLAERKLTAEEYDIMKSHTILGHNIVKGKKELEMVASITIAHHERYDGEGYPYGLSGEEIPLSARITTIVDVYDALRSRRPYKTGWSHKETVDYITQNSGGMFDPVLVEHFMAIHEKFETIYSELRDS